MQTAMAAPAQPAGDPKRFQIRPKPSSLRLGFVSEKTRARLRLSPRISLSNRWLRNTECSETTEKLQEKNISMLNCIPIMIPRRILDGIAISRFVKSSIAGSGSRSRRLHETCWASWLSTF